MDTEENQLSSNKGRVCFQIIYAATTDEGTLGVFSEDGSLEAYVGSGPDGFIPICPDSVGTIAAMFTLKEESVDTNTPVKRPQRSHRSLLGLAVCRAASLASLMTVTSGW